MRFAAITRRAIFCRRESVWFFAALALSTVSTVAVAQSQAAAPTRAAPSTFIISAYDISGATKLDQGVIEAAVYPFVGPDKTSTDVEAARKALQDAYTSRGYESVQVDIPPQPEALFGQGVVQLRVTEAAVGQVQVVGSKYHSPRVVRDQVASLVPGQPLQIKAFSSELDDANRFPDRTVTPSFKPGKEPGTIDVDLKVEDSLPFHASIEVNNDNSPNTVPLRLNGSARYTNLWQLGHTVTATYIVAPEDRHQSEVFSGSYSAPIMGTPWTLVLYGYSSNSNVAALGGVNVLGNGYQVGARAVYRLPSKTLFQNITFGLDYKHFNQNIMLGSAVAGRQPIHYIPLFASYGLSKASDKVNFDVTLSLTAGLRAFRKIGCFEPEQTTSCIPVDQFKNKDIDSNENFVHANLEANYSRAFAHDIVAAARIYGQIADSHLVTNEQFAIGGLSSVRGYYQSEGVGDNGYAGSVELRSPSFASKLPDFVDEVRLYVFVEGGKVYVRNAQADQTSSFALASIGGGTKLKLFKNFSGEVAVGVPLTSGPTTRRGDVRTTFTAKGEF